MFLRGEMSAEAFIGAALSHLMDECPECRQRWHEIASIERYHGTSDLAGRRLAAAEDATGCEEIEQHESRLAALRKERRQARRDIQHLLTLEPQARRKRIENARTRFRSKVFVELLLKKARLQVRQDARTSADLAALVPVAIHWMAGMVDPDWAFRMTCLATAVEANGLRIGGDLPRADRLFQRLKKRLSRRPALGSADLADVLSLEASLRFDQRQYDDTERLLNQAILHHRLADNVHGMAKAVILLGHVHFDRTELQQARRCYAEVTEMLDAEEEPFLAQCAVTGEVHALCGLESFDAAEGLLNHHRYLYEDKDRYHFSLLRNLEGQIAVGRMNWTVAEAAFLDCRDGYLEIGRDHDATLACLDIAAALLQQGKTAEVTQMATEVLEIFRARGADQEALSALILIQEAAASRTLTAAILGKVRRRLESHSG